MHVMISLYFGYVKILIPRFYHSTFLSTVVGVKVQPLLEYVSLFTDGLMMSCSTLFYFIYSMYRTIRFEI